ncbi:MAG TPA: preprotein translocase subunit SecA [Phycisphaerales bacterium]|nr:preprotein translocase subunit SecA [Phycisphaerales bacterium]
MGVPVIGTVMKKLFGTRNERLVKRYLKIVDQVSALEPDIRRLTDRQLREKTAEFRERLEKGESITTLTPEIYAVAREAMDRAVGIRNVFNPEAGFDPSRLPVDVRQLYEKVKAEMNEAPPREPVEELRGNSRPLMGWEYLDIPNRIYDAVRELYPESKPPFRARPFDVQIIGAVVLGEGSIAEMKTGEGKTIVAPLACYIACLQGEQVHVVTVNDYLVQRDRDWTAPFFHALGLTVGAIHPYHMQPPQEKMVAYSCNVVYGTTAEFGFDYLRDNMKLSPMEQVQKKRDFAIVDEVDSTLIDEARTPLIISGPAHQSTPRYDMADRLARHLLEKQKPWNEADQKVQSCLVEISGLEGDIRNARDKDKVPALKERLDAAKAKLPQLEADRDRHTQYYEVEMDKKRAHLTHDGIAEAQKVAGVGSFYQGDNIDLPHLLEQAIRAHTVYQRDRDYVVAMGEDGQMAVVIVDQNTGRKMVGRQWSDGLHQAVEAKEAVPIKQETQTMATITIQNFFKLYKRLAGMTGTADTEATEFYEIYKLDVVSIPTNVPVRRVDRNDLVFMSAKDKWEAIADEIKGFHDIGRPILVGTTSVEKSEHLSEMLTRKHNIKHNVLNAKQHEREAQIIAEAGRLGAVTIATNMAGRGTDIKLGSFTRDELIDHWKRRGICPKEANSSMPEETILNMVYRHMALRELGLKKSDLDAMSDDDVRVAMYRKWYVEYCWGSDKDASKLNEAGLVSALDASGGCLLHRIRLFENVEDIGGLHVIGTERHESRRIDNQLRGRSGRQGDNGSSRFFLSLEDDLMKMFAGPTTLRVLSKLGMKEGDAIEHPMLTKSVTRAQRKVEERNFLIRKNILEYDEVMDHQRHIFYAMRQDVLEGKGIKEQIFEYIEDSVQDAVGRYLDRSYAANCIAEWVREKLNVTIDAERIRGKDREDLHKLIMVDAKEEASSMIRVTMGEYMPEDMDQSEWDLKSMADWANANFKAKVKVSDLQDTPRKEVFSRIERAAERLIDEADLSPLDQYLVPHYGERELARWAQNKFGGEVDYNDFVVPAHDSPKEKATAKLMERARAAYAEREITYPIDFAIEMTGAAMQQNAQQALAQFCAWVKARYELDWNPNALPSVNPAELRKLLIEAARTWDESKIAERAERAVAQGSSPEKLEEWMRTNAGALFSEEERERLIDDPQTVVEEKLAEVLRAELTQFERWVLLQIVDQAWKDHLYAVDQLKESIGLRAFSQKDPRIEFKREGARLFEEMNESIRDKVTDLIFKAKLTVQPQQRPAGPPASGVATAGPDAPGAPAPAPVRPAQSAIAAAAAMASAGTAAQRRDLEAAERATAGGDAEAIKRKPQPAKAAATVGRNEPCPCGSGKKYKQCHGKKA